MKILKQGLLVALMTMTMGAQALTLQAGETKFIFDTYSLTYADYAPGLGVKCLSVAACDLADTNAQTGAFDDGDIWGIFSIAAIQNASTGVTSWVRGQDGQYLTGMYGGLKDYAVETTGGIVQTQFSYMNGGWLDMYLNTVDYTPTLTPAGRTGDRTYTGITGGELALSTMFAGSSVAGLPYSYVASTNIQSVQGAGSGYLDVTGGTLAAQLDTDAMIDTAGGKRDLFFGVKYDDSAFNASQNGWRVTGSGDAKGLANEVPEPGSLALLGLGMIGIAGLRKLRE